MRNFNLLVLIGYVPKLSLGSFFRKTDPDYQLGFNFGGGIFIKWAFKHNFSGISKTNIKWISQMKPKSNCWKPHQIPCWDTQYSSGLSMMFWGESGPIGYRDFSYIKNARINWGNSKCCNISFVLLNKKTTFKILLICSYTVFLSYDFSFRMFESTNTHLLCVLAPK